MDPKINIEIKTRADTLGLKLTEQQIGALTKKVAGLSTVWSSMLGRLTALAGGTGSIGGLITLGVKYNAQLEKTRVTIAGMLKMVNGQEFTTFNAAFARSGQLINELREAGIAAGLSLEAMSGLFVENTAIMTAANIPLARQVALLGRLADLAVAMTGREGVGMELRAMFTGNITDRTKVAKYGLGLTRESILHARETGGLEQLLMSRSAGFAGKPQTLGESMNAIRENVTKVLGREMQPVFEKLAEFAKHLADPQAAKTIAELTSALKLLAVTGAGVAGFSVATKVIGSLAAGGSLAALLAKLTAFLAVLPAFFSELGVLATLSGLVVPLLPALAAVGAVGGAGYLLLRKFRGVRAAEDEAEQAAAGVTRLEGILKSKKSKPTGVTWAPEAVTEYALKYRDILFDQLSVSEKLAELERQRAALFKAMSGQPGGQGTSTQFGALLDIASKRRELLGGLGDIDFNALLTRSSSWATRGFATMGEAGNWGQGMRYVRDILDELRRLRETVELKGLRLDPGAL